MSSSSSFITEVYFHDDNRKDGWAHMRPKLIKQIADGLLCSDVTEYIRMRAVCKQWRDATDDPSHRRHQLSPRFFPRRWLPLPESCFRATDGTHRYLNVLTGASLRIPALEDDDMYTRHGSTEGLLVLHHQLTDTVCLLNPLTQACANLPFASTMCRDGTTSFYASEITAAGVIIDDEARTAAMVASSAHRSLEPVVVLCVTHGQQSTMFYGKPGDFTWNTIDVSCIEQEQESGDDDRMLPAFEGGLAVNGRFYVPTRDGDVLAVELHPKPHLVYVARQSVNHRCIPSSSVRSYLVPSIAGDGDDDGVLLARMHTIASSGVIVGCMLFVLDVAGKRLMVVTARGMVVLLPCATLRSRAFPSLADGIYTEDNVIEIFRRNLV